MNVEQVADVAFCDWLKIAARNGAYRALARDEPQAANGLHRFADRQKDLAGSYWTEFLGTGSAVKALPGQD